MTAVDEATTIAMEQLRRASASLGDDATPEQRLKVANPAVRLVQALTRPAVPGVGVIEDEGESESPA